MLGISIYPEKVQDEKEIYDYIDLAYKYGFKKLFTCLLSSKVTDLEIIKKEFEFCHYAKDLGFEVIVDISPRVLKELNLTYDDVSFFKDCGTTVLRLDLGFDGKTEADISYNEEKLKVEVNMAYDVGYIDLIMDYLPRKGYITASQNFYPQNKTGLELDFFKKCCERYKKYNINTSAFIGDKDAHIGPWPLNDNAVTLEMHRELSVDTQLKHYYQLDMINDFIISTQFSSEDTLRKLSEVDDSILSFKIDVNTSNELEKKIVFDEKHFRRGDSNEFNVRSTQSRVKYKNEDFPPHDTSSVLKRGDIVIGNDDFGQYKGELQVILQDIEDVNQTRNIVGKIVEEELFLLDYLKPWQKFKFEECE